MSQRREAIKKIKSLCSVVFGGSVAYQFIYYKKDFNGYYENVLQPISHWFDPEVSHRIGISAIKYGIFPPAHYTDPQVLKTNIAHYKLSNPVGIAAGFDKHGDAIIGLKNLGFSLIEVGSVTPQPQYGNPKPRVFRLLEDKAVINRYGFNSQGHDEVYTKVHKIKRNPEDGWVLGINLGKNKESRDAVQDYILGIKKFIDVADYFVINISSPNTPGLRALQNKEELQKLLTEVNKTRNSANSTHKTPLFLKVAPDLNHNEMKDIVSVITKPESEVDGLIISNTTTERPSSLVSRYSTESGGLSGKPLADKSTQMIKEMYKLTKGKIPIIGVGGIFTGKDAYEKILAGASAVQIYTAFIYDGPPIVLKIKNELAELLKSAGYKSVNEAVGKGVK